jgi:chromosome segregation ATPase
MSDRKEIIRRHQMQKRDTNVLARNLREARENMQNTMVQAADDVLILTQKLHEVEEKFAQCRVEKEQVDQGAASELELMRSSVADAQERLLAARRETQDRVADLKGAQQTVEKLKRECQELNGSTQVMQQHMSLMQEEISQLRAAKGRLERDVTDLEGEIVAEKNNVKNEISRAQMDRDASKERVTKLQVQLEQALSDSSQVEDFKAENLELKRRVATIQSQLKSSEEARAESEGAMAARHARDLEELQRKYTPTVAKLESELAAAEAARELAVKKGHAAATELQAELDQANSRAAQQVKIRLAAQEELQQESGKLRDMLSAAQEVRNYFIRVFLFDA